MSSEIISTMITGGVGAALGTVLTAIIQVVSKKGESRAIAADRVSNAAGNLADRLDKINAKLEIDNLAMRKALVALTEAVEDLLPLADEATQKKVRDAIHVARIAFR